MSMCFKALGAPSCGAVMHPPWGCHDPNRCAALQEPTGGLRPADIHCSTPTGQGSSKWGPARCSIPCATEPGTGQPHGCSSSSLENCSMCDGMGRGAAVSTAWDK